MQQLQCRLCRLDCRQRPQRQPGWQATRTQLPPADLIAIQAMDRDCNQRDEIRPAAGLIETQQQAGGKEKSENHWLKGRSQYPSFQAGLSGLALTPALHQTGQDEQAQTKHRQGVGLGHIADHIADHMASAAGVVDGQTVQKEIHLS